MKAVYYLSISRWHHRPMHFYGTIRTRDGKVAQEIFQCATRTRVIQIARQWCGKKRMVVRKMVEYF